MLTGRNFTRDMALRLYLRHSCVRPQRETNNCVSAVGDHTEVRDRATSKRPYWA
jgi:hypothetical protein